jgi:hypothetical protein
MRRWKAAALVLSLALILTAAAAGCAQYTARNLPAGRRIGTAVLRPRSRAARHGGMLRARRPHRPR